MPVLSVRVFIVEDSQPLAGAIVQLRERRADRPISPTARTNRSGIASLRVPRSEGNPFPRITFDLCLLGKEGQVILRRHVKPQQMRSYSVSIPLTIAQATAFGLYFRKQRRTPEQQAKKWCQHWSKALEREKTSTHESLCLTRSLLDIMSDAENQSSQLGKMVAEIARDRLEEKDIVSSARAALKAMEHFDSCEFPGIPPDTCSADQDWVALTKEIFFSEEGSGSQVMKGLTATIPDPRDNLGTPAPGIPFTYQPEFVKDCLDEFRHGTLPSDIQDVMREIIEEDIRVLFPPSVNLVEAWAQDPWRSPDDRQGQTVRFGEVHNEFLTVWERVAPTENDQRTFSTDVELDDPECFILEMDEDGRQRFFSDVKPGQVVSLKGSGFINETAKVHVEFRRMEGVDDQGRIVFRDQWENVPGFNDSDLGVYGVSDTSPVGNNRLEYSMDSVVLEWPAAAAEPGLYRFRLEMKNETEHYISIIQDPETCEITMVKDGSVPSNSIHFVVVPEVTAKRVQIVGSQVHCADETDPEEIMFVNLADDVIYEITAQLFEVKFDPNATDPSLAVSLEGVGELGEASGRRRFWDAPDTWQSDLRPFPPAPEIFTTLG